mgnify:CR=1 FL=1
MVKLEQESREFYKKVFALVIPMALQNLINTGITTADRVYSAVAKALNRAKGRVRLTMTFFSVSTPSRVRKPLLLHIIPIASAKNTGRAVEITEISLSIAYLITPFCRMILA